ncbi:MAG: hypothetical protein D6737_07355 [Chloroflexi bacterium]|nr:MAG: hypothetical protein CUN54_07315 [Phototrophicales bacterium]RMF80659.1 MAG: hypothetical protein D6737_07355 [Chloroflexota bacterium]
MTDQNKKSPVKRVFLLFLLVFIVGAGILMMTGFSASQSAAADVDTVSVAKNTAADAAALLGDDDRLLVWLGNGAAAGQHPASNPGQIGFVDQNGNFEPIVDVPPQTSRVRTCGQGTSPNGRYYAFYMGLDFGNIYFMDRTSMSIIQDSVQATACLGESSFQFSPNSERFAYIDFEPGSATDEFADGFLKIFNSEGVSEIMSFENTSSFDINNDGLAFISLFTNDRNEADEAAIFWWNGNTEREVATLLPEEDCRFTNSAITIDDDNRFLAVIGHRCRAGDTRTQWQLYQIDPEARAFTLLASDFQPGAFVSFARTNNVFIAPNGETAYFTVPDGVTANTAAVAAINLSDSSITVPVGRQMIFPTFQGGANAFPVISPNGRWLAGVVTSPNNDNSLTVLDLNNPNTAPVVIPAGSRGDTISSMQFTPNSERLIYVAGGDNSANNSIFALDLESGGEFRVRRGRFAQGLAISPNGEELMIGDWQVREDPQDPPFQFFTVVNIDNSDSITLFEGAEIVDGEVTNQRFMFPLSWRES